MNSEEVQARIETLPKCNLRFNNYNDVRKFNSGNSEVALRPGDTGYGKAGIQMSYVWHPKAIEFTK